MTEAANTDPLFDPVFALGTSALEIRAAFLGSVCREAPL